MKIRIAGNTRKQQGIGYTKNKTSKNVYKSVEK